MKNIWVSADGQNAIDLDQVRHIYIFDRQDIDGPGGCFKIGFEFTPSGFNVFEIERYGKEDKLEAEESAQLQFQNIIAKWRGA